MTTEQKLAHIEWYINQIGLTQFKPTKMHWISMARGAAGAWFADMTITHAQYKDIERQLNDLVEDAL